MASSIKTVILFLLPLLLAYSVLAAPDITDGGDKPGPEIDDGGGDKPVPGDGGGDKPVPDDGGGGKPVPGNNDGASDYAKPAIEPEFMGAWVIDNPNAGVAAMQLQLMPNDQVVWFDTTSLGPSGFKLPEGTACPNNPDANNQPDCYAHAIAYDWKTSKYRPLTLQGDAWCSSGNLWPNGNLMATGGTFSGDKAIRVIANDDPNGDFKTKIGALADTRWYSSNQVLADGSSVVLGGRDSYSYEIVPPQMEFKPQRFDLPFIHFLQELSK